MAEMMGSVYILVNKNIPGWIKVGRSQGLANQHARQMTRKTGVSEPFEVAYEVRCERSEKLEQDMHHELNECLREDIRSFNRCDFPAPYRLRANEDSSRFLVLDTVLVDDLVVVIGISASGQQT